MAGKLIELRARHAREERTVIAEALIRHGGNQSAAADELGIAQPSLHRLVHETYPDLAVHARHGRGRRASGSTT